MKPPLANLGLGLVGAFLIFVGLGVHPSLIILGLGLLISLVAMLVGFERSERPEEVTS